MEQAPAAQRRTIALWFLAGLGALVLGYFTLQSLMVSGGPAKKPPKISLIPTTPPPPPPPPKEEKKPEPKEQKEEKMQAPQEQKIAPPDNPTLKMEGAAGDGPSAFSAGRVTSEDLSKLGNGGGSGLLNPFNTYANTLRNELQRQLARQSDLKKKLYRVEVRIWVGDDGHLKQFELMGTTTDADMDDAIRQALTKFTAFSEAPPAKMPQPIRFRLTSSGRS